MGAAMQSSEIYELLRSALVELFEIEPERISPQALIYEDLEIDSIDAIDLIDHIKRQTGHRLAPEDFKSVRTLQDIVDCVARKVENS